MSGVVDVTLATPPSLELEAEEAARIIAIEYGPSGPRGLQGIQGIQGVKGDLGDTGPQGIPGIQGAKGDKGDTGNTGTQGIQGTQGVKGDTGDTGAKGDTGNQGIQGVPGIQGAKGDKGDTGNQGLTGPAGQSFNWLGDYDSVRSYNFDDAVMGSDGSSYISMQNGNVGHDPTLQPANVAWWSRSTIHGAVGPQGAQGIQGVKGDTGNAGSQGIQGIQGVKGDTGNTGDTGPQGIQGVKGDKGDTGNTGNTGPQGIQGIQGVAGNTGPAGPNPAYGTGAPSGGADRDLKIRSDEPIPPNSTQTVNDGIWEKQGAAYVRIAPRFLHGDNHGRGAIDPVTPASIGAIDGPGLAVNSNVFVVNYPRNAPAAWANTLNPIGANSGKMLVFYGFVFPGGQPINKIYFLSGSTAVSGPTHQWAAVLDANRTVLAVSSDDAANAWGANAWKAFTLQATYTPVKDTAVGIGIVVAFSTTAPNFTGVVISTNTPAPMLIGLSSTAAMTTPVATGTVMGALAAQGQYPYIEVGS